MTGVRKNLLPDRKLAEAYGRILNLARQRPGVARSKGRQGNAPRFGPSKVSR